MAASTIPAAKLALLTALQARVGLTGVQVQWGAPADPPAVLESVYVDDAVDVQREWTSLGAGVLEETYTIEVRVETLKYGTDRQATEERMWELVAEVEQAARDDYTLGGTLSRGLGAKPEGVEPTTVPTDEGWFAHAVVRIACNASTVRA